MSKSELVNIFIRSVKYFLNFIHFFFKFKVVLTNVPTRHLYSHCKTKATLLHLSPTSSKVRSNMQSAVSLVMDQSLVAVMIYAFVTVLKLINHGAILEAHINLLLVMSMAVNKQRTFLLVSTSS